MVKMTALTAKMKKIVAKLVQKDGLKLANLMSSKAIVNAIVILRFVMVSNSAQMAQMNGIAQFISLAQLVLLDHAIEANLLVQMETVFEVPGNVTGTMTVEMGQMNKIVQVS